MDHEGRVLLARLGNSIVKLQSTELSVEQRAIMSDLDRLFTDLVNYAGKTPEE